MAKSRLRQDRPNEFLDASLFVASCLHRTRKSILFTIDGLTGLCGEMERRVALVVGQIRVHTIERERELQHRRRAVPSHVAYGRLRNANK